MSLTTFPSELTMVKRYPQTPLLSSMEYRPPPDAVLCPPSPEVPPYSIAKLFTVNIAASKPTMNTEASFRTIFLLILSHTPLYSFLLQKNTLCFHFVKKKEHHTGCSKKYAVFLMRNLTGVSRIVVMTTPVAVTKVPFTSSVIPVPPRPTATIAILRGI